MSVTVERKPTYREMRSRAEEIADEKIKVRVLKALALLQEKHGDDWVEHIRPETLDLGSARHCVLGQLYSDLHGSSQPYYAGLDDLGIAGSQYAFDSWGDVSYRKLTDAWQHVFTGEDF